MTFFISLFILVMQLLWRYVDDLVGKGLEVSVLLELLFYASLQVVPMALPLAILLASLMTFGNLGEHYELTALKASGISLPKILSPLIVFTVIVAIAAFKFSNNVLPVANLKFSSLMWSVRKSRPEFDIKEKIFYDGLEDFNLKIESKSKNGEMLYDIMIYDHRDSHSGNTNVTIADSGKLQFTEDGKFLKLTLFDGVRYDENIGENNKSTRKEKHLQFRTDKFKKQIAMIPLSNMGLNRLDEGLFTGHGKMKNLKQLEHDTDSLIQDRQKSIDKLQTKMEKQYFVYNDRNKSRRRNKKIAKNKSKEEDAKEVVSELEKPIESYPKINVDSTFNNLTNQRKVVVLGNALRKAREAKNKIDDQINVMAQTEKHIIRHKIEWHRKFTLSIACIIFFFIGAPLGAIIRKGGLGMPVVVSVLFFIVYYIIDTMGLKASKEGAWTPFMGIWLSSMVLFPIGAFLTYKASTDSAILNSDAYIIFFQKFFKKFKKKKE